jgi:hypothetical protein
MEENIALDHVEKAKIKLQETYRNEIRKQLEAEAKSRSSSKRLWEFLNSGLGLWLLSAILITGVGALYTQYQNTRAEKIRTKELIERLDLEIGYRFSLIQIQFDSIVNDKDPKYPFLPGKGENDVKKALDNLSQPPKGEYPSLYQEFSNMSTLALIAELRRHVPKEDQDELEQVLAHLSGIYIRLRDVKHVALTDVKGVADTVFNDLTLPRWMTVVQLGSNTDQPSSTDVPSPSIHSRTSQ